MESVATFFFSGMCTGAVVVVGGGGVVVVNQVGSVKKGEKLFCVS